MQKEGRIILTTAIIIAIAFTIGITWYRNGLVDNAVLPKASSEGRWYTFVKESPITNAPTVYLYSFKDHTTTPIENILVNSLESQSQNPRGKGFLFTDSERNLLWIDYETKKTRLIASDKQGDFNIRAWSPDGARAAVWRASDELNDSESYLFEVNDYAFTKLPVSPLATPLAFIGNNQILFVTGANNGEQFSVYDILTNTLDTNRIPGPLKWSEVAQPSFSADGMKWAFITSRNPTGNTSIVVADFPNQAGKIIASGAWAEVQLPIISPEGDKVVYQFQASVPYSERSDNLEFRTMLYDLVSGKSTVIATGSGRAKYWLDNRSVVIERVNESTFRLKDAVLVDVEKKQVDSLDYEVAVQALYPSLSPETIKQGVLYVHPLPGQIPERVYAVKLFDPNVNQYAIIARLEPKVDTPSMPFKLHEGKIFFLGIDGFLTAYDLTTKRVEKIPIYGSSFISPSPSPTDPQILDFTMEGNEVILLVGTMTDDNPVPTQIIAYQPKTQVSRVIIDDVKKVFPPSIYSVLWFGPHTALEGKREVIQAGGDAEWGYAKVYSLNLADGAVKLITDESTNGEGDREAFGKLFNKEEITNCGEALVTTYPRRDQQFSLTLPDIKPKEFSAKFLGCVD